MLKKPLHHLQEVYWEQLAKTEAASCSSLGISLGIQEEVNSLLMLILEAVFVFLPSCPSHLHQLGFNSCINKYQTLRLL